MKRTIYTLFILPAMLVIMKGAYGQQYDRYWMGKNWYFDGTETLMRFDEDTITYHTINLPEKITIENGILAMSNAAGELQFYTNGNVVVSWDHKVMSGGKGFNEGSTSDDFLYDPPWSPEPDTTYNVSYVPYAYKVIPDAEDENTYYMVHAFVMTVGGCKYYDVPKMQISKIDMSANGGKGKVVYKNRYFHEELVGVSFVLVRHGNGRDWWVVLRKQDGLSYKSILLHRDSVVQVVQSTVPLPDLTGLSFNNCFTASTSPFEVSMDGSMLIDVHGFGVAKLMAFDRCSGEVSLMDTFATGISTMFVYNGVVDSSAIFTYRFSPSGRYLYGAGYHEFAQWDLEAPDIAASKVKLGGVPWALNDDQSLMPGITGGFTAFAQGPDGRIYNLFRTSNSVIEYPDEKGEACGLCLAADNAPASCLNNDVPYYLYSGRHPNFRLGALEGSGCDTILSGTQPPLVGSGYGVSASPSPASGQVEVSIALPSYGNGIAEVQVFDIMGRVVHRHRFAPFSYLHTLEVGGWPPGVYNILLLDGGRPRAAARLVVVG